MAESSPQSARANRVPVSIVTGFLGSGKTTLLNRLIRHPGMGDTAVIVNEFGEIGIDHELVDSAFENTVLMDSGCICCSIRGDLVDTVNDLFANAELGKIPSFSRILVETTGLADPLPVLHALKSGEDIAARCTAGSVIATADAQQGEAQLARHEEVARQIAVADVVVVTKTDIAGAESARRLERRIRTLNPGVAVRIAVGGHIDPEQLFRHAGAAAARDAAELLRAPPDRHRDDHDHAHDHAHDRSHAHDHDPESDAAHGAIRAHAITADAPLSLERLSRFLETVFSLRGQCFLRVKGIVDAQGIGQPVLIQGVGNTFSPPALLEAWPEGPRRSRLVFIVDGLDPAGLDGSFAALVLEAGGASAT